MFGSFLPGLGWLAPPKSIRAWEPTLLWNQLHSFDPAGGGFDCNGLVYIRGCQEHFSPSAGGAGLVRDIQPLSHRRRSCGVVPLGYSISAAASSVSSDDADQFRNGIKPCGCTVSTMGLSEARGLVLFRVIRGGIGVTQRLGATGTVSSTGHCHTHPRTRASPEPTGHHQKRSPEMEGLFTRDAQAACDFSFSASKFSPFFHRVSVIAAILRASVRRAMVGLMPLASAAW